jgi:hypothetical protein
MRSLPMTVVETQEFSRRAKVLMSASQRVDLVAFVGANPEAGEIVPVPVVSVKFDGRWTVEANAVARG